jgi:peptide/nickel transport system permease protein
VEEAIMRLADFTFAFPALLLGHHAHRRVWGRHRQLHHRHWHLQHPDVCAGHAGLGQRRVGARIHPGRACLRQGPWRITLEHVLPNILSVLIVQATIQFALAILAEAALSYLGLGTQPPQPSWGRMLSEAQTLMFQAPLLAVWPGVAIALAVLGLNLLGDGLRDLLDPAWREKDDSPSRFAPSPSLYRCAL